MAEGLSATEVGKDIAERGREARAGDAEPAHAGRHDRLLSIAEAILLSAVTLLAAWSGYSAAKWGSDASISLAKASAARTQASRYALQANQVRTQDSVKFNSAFGAYAAHDAALLRLAIDRFRPNYRRAFDAWVATRPLKSAHPIADPSEMPQYRLPGQARSRSLDAQADASFAHGQAGLATSDRYVRLTVVLAAILFLVGISTQFTVRTARHGLLGIACVLLIVSLVQVADLPGPPS